MNRNRYLPPLLLALTLALAATGAARAQSAPADPPASATAAATAVEADWVDGEVRKVDAAQGRLTLRHGPLPQLSMPPMTMVFRVADAALLDGLQIGDAVRFTVERRTTGLTVTRIAPAAR
jgi:Cu(I)/Ag(I) efflux system periplasmic protein CusF